MSRIAVVTDPDTGLGFKLSGIEVFHASSYEDAEGYLEGFLRGREYGIVAYSEEFAAHFSKSISRRIEESMLPVFIAIPSIKSWQGVEKGEEYVARILQRTLGFYVKIKK